MGIKNNLHQHIIDIVKFKLEAMVVNNNKFQLKQIQGEIHSLFEDLIDLSDLEGTRINKDNAFLSRGLAAYTLHFLADISPNEAAQSIIDGTGDNGIDAIFWHKNDNVLWLIQSKWIQKGSGQPEYGDINKFATGVRNLVDDNLDRPNSKLNQKKYEIEKALATIGVKIKLVITHTGQGISKKSRRCLDDIIKDFNENDDDSFSYEVFDKPEAYRCAVENANQIKIEAEFNLSNWGKVDDPYTAFYGSVSALDLAKLWLKHKNKLFAKNLRDFIGQTKANDEITQTLKNDPTSFWYFNNGVTVLCQELRKKTKGTKRLNDDVIVKGISVINGAQTIGSIGRVYEEKSEYLEEYLEEAAVFIKLISLENCPDDFGIKVTKATNTQNNVESRDFVSLDPIQQKLAKELKAWDKEKTYFYKRSAEMVSNENACTLTEATIALACFHSELELAILAKKDVSDFWKDTSSSRYKTIFNSSVSPVQLWRTVEIYRFLEKKLVIKAKESKIFSQICNHGNLFILHLIFQVIQKQNIKVFDNIFRYEDYELVVNPIIQEQLNIVCKCLENRPAYTRLGILFKSNNKCEELKQEIVASQKST